MKRRSYSKVFLAFRKKQPIQRYACLYHESRLKLLFQGAVVYKNAKNSMWQMDRAPSSAAIISTIISTSVWGLTC